MSLHRNDQPTSRNALGSHPYDFGVHGMHDVAVENVRDGEVGAEISAFVDGARSVPPEDVGVAAASWRFWRRCFSPFHAGHRGTIGRHGGPFDRDDMGERRARMRLGT